MFSYEEACEKNILNSSNKASIWWCFYGSLNIQVDIDAIQVNIVCCVQYVGVYGSYFNVSRDYQNEFPERLLKISGSVPWAARYQHSRLQSCCQQISLAPHKCQLRKQLQLPGQDQFCSPDPASPELTPIVSVPGPKKGKKYQRISEKKSAVQKQRITEELQL